MANVVNSNTIYIDSTGDISNTANISVVSITMTTSAAGGSLTLRDQTTGDNKISLKIATDEQSEKFPYEDAPIVFPNGINVNAISGAVATLVVRRQGRG